MPDWEEALGSTSPKTVTLFLLGPVFFLSRVTKRPKEGWGCRWVQGCVHRGDGQTDQRQRAL